jgi:hypothetical protein
MALPSISDAINVRSLEDLKSLFGLIPVMIDDIIVDVLSRVEVDYSFNITSKPCEEGYINDARIANPITMRMECVFSNNIENMTLSGLGKSLLAGNFSLDSWKQKRDALLELKNKNKIITVVTPDKKYDNLMIERLVITREDAHDACFFSIDLVEVSIKKTAMSSVSDQELPDKVKDKEDKVASKRTKGKSKATPPPPVSY